MSKLSSTERETAERIISGLSEALATARTEARNAALEEAAPVIANLAAVLWQVLDDMGEHGHSVCGATKATARAALGRVASPSLEIDYTMAQAEAVFKEIGGEPVMDMEPDELVEPWSTAIRARIGTDPTTDRGEG